VVKKTSAAPRECKCAVVRKKSVNQSMKNMGREKEKEADIVSYY